MLKTRGLVISPPFTVRPAGGIAVGGCPSAEDLRKYILYWDELDLADNNFISVAAGPDFQFLMDAKVATRTKVRFQGTISSGSGEFFILAQQKVFEKRQVENPGAWSLAQLSTTPYFANAKQATAVEYELWNMLPVPERDVPLNEILEFKAKRYSELVALRIHLDELYQSIISSADVPRSKNTQLTKLEISLNEVDKTLGESGIRKTYTSLRGFIAGDFVNIAGFALSAAGVAPLVSITPFAAGTVGACIAFAARSMRLPSIAKGPDPLTYISSVKKGIA